MLRNDCIKIIKDALKRRTGKIWSVTGGKGTAYGWITINAPPARRTSSHRLLDGKPDWPGNYVEYDCGKPGHNMTPADRETLKKALGLDSVHEQGISIPSSNDYYAEYIARAEGRTPAKIAQPYWD